LDELHRRGRDWSEFLCEVNLSQEHPTMEDVHLSVNTQPETSIPDVPINLTESNPSLVHEQTPVQETQPRKSIWRAPKRKKGSNRPLKSEPKEIQDPPRRMTRSMMRNQKLPSPKPMNVETKPIDLATPVGSPVKEVSKYLKEELADTLLSADYTSQDVNRFFSSPKKDKAKATSPTPQPNTFTFASQIVDSDPIVEPSEARVYNLVDKLKEDIRIAKVLESHLKKENGILKDRIHKLQDKYDSLKRKHKATKKQIK